jgi:hypothetical protein
MPNVNQELLTAALEGLEIRKQRLEEQIAEVRSLLRSSGGRARESEGQGQEEGQPRKRVLSAAARKRIAAAQRKRWAAAKKAAAGQNAEAKPVRRRRRGAKRAAAKKAAAGAQE